MSTLRTQFIQDLQLAGLSERTQEAYVRSVRKLAEHYDRPPDLLTETQIRDYFLFLKNQRNFAPASLKMAFYGIRYFYTHTVPREWPTLAKFRVAKEKKLPDVLSVDEVHTLVDAVRTIHNKTYLWTVYSLGLRLNEGLHLQIGDIDSQRMLVHVHRGKGAKDRYVPLPVKTLTMLRDYWATHRNPKWLFPATGRNHQKAASATDGRASLKYLAPYVFRVAISDRRIVCCADGKVTFLVKKSGSRRWRKMTQGAMEFIRRFLQHALPAGFQKVRHFGFLSPQSKTDLDAVRWLIALYYDRLFVLLCRVADAIAPPMPSRCPDCGGPMIVRGYVPPARGPPAATESEAA